LSISNALTREAKAALQAIVPVEKAAFILWKSMPNQQKISFAVTKWKVE